MESTGRRRCQEEERVLPSKEETEALIREGEEIFRKLASIIRERCGPTGWVAIDTVNQEWFFGKSKTGLATAIGFQKDRKKFLYTRKIEDD